MFISNTWNSLTVPKLNWLLYIAMFETIKLCANKMIDVRQQYFKLFKWVLTND